MVDGDISVHVDAFEMMVIQVGAGGHARPTPQCLVRVDGQVIHPDRSEAAW